MIGNSKESVVLERVRIPPPVFFRSIEPCSLADQDKLDASLALLRQEDPSLQVSSNPETGQTLIGGMGELHLEYLLDRLEKHYKVKGIVGDIMIAYRCASVDSFSDIVDASLEYESGGKTVQAYVKMRVVANDFEVAETFQRAEDGVQVVWKGEEKLKVRGKNDYGNRVSKLEKKKNAGKDVKAFESIREGVLAACNRVHPKGFPVVNVEVEVLEFQVDGDDWTSVLKVKRQDPCSKSTLILFQRLALKKCSERHSLKRIWLF